MEDNKLLAEFMGLVESIIPNQYWTEKSSEGFGMGKLKELKYHTDWNWLMQVVEKIESLGVVVEIRENVCYIETTTIDYYSELEETKIQATYIACVRFVKWYNEQNKI
jgi:hypothetical protein